MWACMIVMSSEPVWSLQMKHFLRIIQYNYSSSRPGQMNHLFHPVTLFPLFSFQSFHFFHILHLYLSHHSPQLSVHLPEADPSLILSTSSVQTDGYLSCKHLPLLQWVHMCIFGSLTIHLFVLFRGWNRGIEPKIGKIKHRQEGKDISRWEIVSPPSLPSLLHSPLGQSRAGSVALWLAV